MFDGEPDAVNTYARARKCGLGIRQGHEGDDVTGTGFLDGVSFFREHFDHAADLLALAACGADSIEFCDARGREPGGPAGDFRRTAARSIGAGGALGSGRPKPAGNYQTSCMVISP